MKTYICTLILLCISTIDLPIITQELCSLCQVPLCHDRPDLPEPGVVDHCVPRVRPGGVGVVDQVAKAGKVLTRLAETFGDV